MKNKPLPPKKFADTPLRLFAIKTKDGVMLDTYYTNKTAAKAMRDKLIESGQHAEVVVGPDHRRHPEYAP